MKKQQNKEKQDSVKKQKKITAKQPAAIAGTGSVTNRVRARAGRGLENEGTNVSYDDEQRNG